VSHPRCRALWRVGDLVGEQAGAWASPKKNLYRPLDVSRFLYYNRTMTKTPTLKTETYRVDRSHYSDNLDRMHTLAAQIEEATAELRRLAKLTRQEGATWEDIGRELGVTRSAAQQRFGA